MCVYCTVKIANPFRSLRSGKEFSPWSMGTPIATTFDFSIADRLAEVKAERIALETTGYQSEDEREVETHTLPPSPPFEAWSANLSPLTPIRNSVDLSPIPPISPLPQPYLSIFNTPCTSTATAPGSPPIPPSESSSKNRKTKPRHKKTDHRKAGAKKCRLKHRLRHLENTRTVLKAVNVRRRKDLNPIYTNIDVTNLDHASTAWIGKPEQFNRAYYNLDELTGPEFNFVKHSWDGK
jgi:hypothetical protein